MELEEGSSYLSTDLDVDCHSKSHQRYATIVLCVGGLVYVIGIPCYIRRFVTSQKNKIVQARTYNQLEFLHKKIIVLDDVTGKL